MSAPHPVCRTLRELRKATGLSLNQVQARQGINAIVLGSYERGDRIPPLNKIEEILNAFGYTLKAVPQRADAVRIPADMADELRLIADQLDGKTSVALQ